MFGNKSAANRSQYSFLLQKALLSLLSTTLFVTAWVIPVIRTVPYPKLPCQGLIPGGGGTWLIEELESFRSWMYPEARGSSFAWLPPTELCSASSSTARPPFWDLWLKQGRENWEAGLSSSRRYGGCNEPTGDDLKLAVGFLLILECLFPPTAVREDKPRLRHTPKAGRAMLSWLSRRPPSVIPKCLHSWHSSPMASPFTSAKLQIIRGCGWP